MQGTTWLIEQLPYPELMDGAVARLKRAEPGLQAVILAGSFARGEGDGFSDVDLVAVTEGEPLAAERTWFAPRPDGRLLHFSVAGESLITPVAVPADWSLGFPVAEPQVYLWATEAVIALLGSDPSLRLPAAAPELEDFVELAVKARRARKLGDRILLRWSARLLAEYGAGLARELNPEQAVRTPAEALKAALQVSNVPTHYRTDFEICYGLLPAPDEDLAASAHRFSVEMLQFLRMQRAHEGVREDDVWDSLSKGALEIYLEQSASS